jgi:periplasmic divalent cation tolerance protein
MSKHVVVLITTGSKEEADRIANALVAEMLAACVNVIPGVTSVYRWQGEVQRAQEWLLVAKSRTEVLNDVIRRVKALHSYDVPEIIALPLAGGNDTYLRWIDNEVHGGWHAVD